MGPVAAPVQLGAGLTRKDVHLADIDGDGKCDYIVVNPLDRSFSVYFNHWTNGQALWTTAIDYTADFVETLCPNQNGIGLFDLAVRFADIDGDGRADYLCLDLDGRTTGNLPATLKSENNGIPGSYTSVGQVKFSEGADRANIRFADVDGDGMNSLF